MFLQPLLFQRPEKHFFLFFFSNFFSFFSKLLDKNFFTKKIKSNILPKNKRTRAQQKQHHSLLQPGGALKSPYKPALTITVAMKIATSATTSVFSEARKPLFNSPIFLIFCFIFFSKLLDKKNFQKKIKSNILPQNVSSLLQASGARKALFRITHFPKFLFQFFFLQSYSIKNIFQKKIKTNILPQNVSSLLQPGGALKSPYKPALTITMAMKIATSATTSVFSEARKPLFRITHFPKFLFKFFIFFQSYSIKKQFPKKIKSNILPQHVSSLLQASGARKALF